MNKKTRIFILFFLLGVTPFIRGCDYSFGFPFPALGYAPNVHTFLETMRQLSWQETYEFILYAIANILTAYLLARRFLITYKDARWSPFVLTALAVNVCWHWTLFLSSYLQPEQPVAVAILEAYQKIGSWFIHIPYEIYQKTKWSPDVIARVWFVITTLFLAGALYAAVRLKALYARSRKRPL